MNLKAVLNEGSFKKLTLLCKNIKRENDIQVGFKS